MKGLLTITVATLLFVQTPTTLATQSSLAFEVGSIKPVKVVRECSGELDATVGSYRFRGLAWSELVL